MQNKEFIGTEATAISFLDNFFGIFLGWILHMFLSRSLGPSVYGQFSLIIVIFGIFTTWLTPGVAFAVTRYAPLDSNPWRVFNAGLRVEIIFDVFVYCIYFSILNYICHFLSIYELQPHLIVLGIMIMPHGIANIALGYLRGRLEFIRILKVNLLSNVTKITFCILLVLKGYHLWGVVLGLAIAEIILFICSFFAVKPHNLRTLSFLKEIIFSSLPFWMMITSSYIMQRIDIICIRLLLPDYSQVGYYAAALRLGELLLFLLSMNYVHLLPVLSSAFHKQDYFYAQDSVKRSLRYCFLCAMPLCLWTAIHSKLIMSFVFSYKFSQGYLVLSIFSLGTILFSLLSVFNSVLLASNKLWFLFKINTLFIVFNIIFNILLIPILGISGAAIATIVSLVLIGLSIFIHAHRLNLLKQKKIIWLSKRTIFNVLVATCTMVAIDKFIYVMTWYLFVLKTTIAILLYAGLLLLLREINDEDKNIINFIIKTLPGRIKFYS